MKFVVIALTGLFVVQCQESNLCQTVFDKLKSKHEWNIDKIDMGELGEINNLTLAVPDRVKFPKCQLIHLSPTEMGMTMALARVTLQATFNLNSYSIPGSSLVINGSGSLSATANHVLISGVVKFDYNGKPKIQYINKFQFRMGNIDGQVSGISNAEEVSKFMTSELPDYLNKNVDELFVEHLHTILRAINNQMAKT